MTQTQRFHFSPGPARITVCVTVLVVVSSWMAANLTAQNAPKLPGPDFASFENKQEVSQWRATGAAAVRSTTDFPSWQTNSLRLTVPAGSTGGVETNYIPRDWHRREALQFFVYAQQPVTIKVAISDGAKTASQSARLKKGSNHVQLRLKAFPGVNLHHVTRLRLRPLPTNGSVTLYLDRFRLTEYNEVLARLGRMDAPYGMDIVTPHVNWANPYAGGLLQVLIVPDVAHGRSAIELAQRLQCRLFPVTLGFRSGTNRWGFGDFYGQRGYSYGAPFTLAYTYLADDLLNGPRYDVMVLPGTQPWDEFPGVVRKAIRRRVEAGMGLVLIAPRVSRPAKAAELAALSPLLPVTAERAPSPAVGQVWNATGAHYITRNLPLDAFPYDQLSYQKARINNGKVLIRARNGDPIVAIRRVGRGRVVTAVYEQRGLIPLVKDQWKTSATWHYWEYMYSLLARSVVWAAGKQAAGMLKAIRFDRAVNPATVRIAVTPPAAGRKLQVTVRDEYSATELTENRPVPVATGAITLSLPAHPRGRLHFVDVILRDARGRTLDWGTATYTTPLPVAIAAVHFTSDRFQLGAPVTGHIDIKGTPKPSSSLRFRLYDNYGRLLAEKTEPLSAAGSHPFSVSSEGCLTRLARLDAELLDGSRPRQKKRREVFILQPQKWDHYDVVMYLFGSDPAPGLWDTVQQRLKQMYVTTLSSYPLELSKHANFGVQAQTRISGQESPDGAARKPYLERKREYARTHDTKYLARLYCLNDPAYLAQEKREIDEKVTPWVPFSPMSYYIYEEPSLTCYSDAMDLCFSPYCMAKMRIWLKKQYGSLEALNRQWGTSFRAWDQVTPDTTEQAQRRGNYSSWADHRTFMEITYAGNYAYVHKLLRQHDPHGLVLLSGTQDSTAHNGCDYSRLDHIVDHLNPYNGGGQSAFHRSFNPHLYLSGGSGYGVHGRKVLYNFYSNLFHGDWAGSYVFWQYSILNPDYRFCRSARDIQAGYREIVDGGIARLIRDAVRDNDGIAIHYSYPSIHASWIIDGQTHPPAGENPDRLGEHAGPAGMKFEASREGWISVLHDLGLQFDFVPRQDIEAGELLHRKFRLLILPFSLSLTDREVAQIKRFVNAGGVVIADGQAGVMDGHAKWLPAGSLDDLFGISRPAPVRKTELESSQPETSLRLTGSAALTTLAGAPVLIHRRYGAGQAIYLNFFLTRYTGDRHEGRAGKWMSLVGRTLKQAGVSTPYPVLTTGDRPLQNFELVTYRAGSTRYLGLVKEDDIAVTSEPTKIVLPRQRAVYDVRAKRYLGALTAIQGQIRTAEPKLYALLAAPIQGLTLSAASAPKRGRRFTYQVQLNGPAGARSAAIIKVYRPDGSLVREYSKVLGVRSGQLTSANFYLALNDPPGTWKIVANGAISGKKATFEFDLR